VAIQENAMQSKRQIAQWLRWLMILAAVGAVGVAGWYMVVHKAAAESAGAGSSEPGTTVSSIAVEVATPRQGGIDRLCTQPGSLEPFEGADLYAKVSGYLAEQKVDIGSPVKAGEVLARLWVPEFDKQVKQDSTDIERAKARVDQMKAAVATAEADRGAATALVALAREEVKSKTAYRAYREKQRARIQDLVSRQAIDAKLADEQEDQYQAAVAGELASNESVNAARQKEAAAKARVDQANADLAYARAEVGSAEARLEKSRVMLDYTCIRSPYTGVITRRNFHPGDFIRSADAGGDRVPLLAVERTDILRLVVQVPERDVPFVEIGTPAVVELDALPGMAWKTHGTDKVEVSRFAASEDPNLRMMRTEVDLKNPDGKLRRGMFGRVTLLLKQGSQEAMRIPSGALVGKAEGGKGTVRVIRNDKACFVEVRYGTDNGGEVEVLSGLTNADQVIVSGSGPLNEGTPVVVSNTKSSSPRR
jgi:HlyD family secretion protein